MSPETKLVDKHIDQLIELARNGQVKGVRVFLRAFLKEERAACAAISRQEAEKASSVCAHSYISAQKIKTVMRVALDIEAAILARSADHPEEDADRGQVAAFALHAFRMECKMCDHCTDWNNFDGAISAMREHVLTDHSKEQPNG